MEQQKVSPAEGKLGILVVGCGAVSTTFMTGVLMARKGLTKPVGSMTMQRNISNTMRLSRWPVSTRSCSVAGMFILRMLSRQLCMPKC